MKNKKLFAILTLVCFMFTLMPVAAFAATNGEGSFVYVNDTAVDTKENVEVEIDGVANTDVYVWFEAKANVPTTNLDKVYSADGKTELTGAFVAGIDVDVVKVKTDADGHYVFNVTFTKAGDYEVHASYEQPKKTVGSTTYATWAEAVAAIADYELETETDDVVTVSADSGKTSDYVIKASTVAVASANATVNHPTKNFPGYYEDGDTIEIKLTTAEANGIDEVDVQFNVYEEYDKDTDTYGDDVYATGVEIDSTNKVAISDVKAKRTGVVSFTAVVEKVGTHKVNVEIDGFEVTVKFVAAEGDAEEIVVDYVSANPVNIDTVLDTDNSLVNSLRFAIYDKNGNEIKADHESFNKALDYTNGYVSIVEQPADSDLENDDLKLDWIKNTKSGNEGWTIVSKAAIEEEGNYTFKVALNDGTSVKATLTVMESGDYVALNVVYNTDSVQLGATIKPKSIIWMDANKVSTSAAGKVEFTASGSAIADVDGTTIEVKDDEKYIGSTIEVTVVDEDNNLIATKTLTVASEAKELVFDVPAVPVDATRTIGVKLVDEDGKTVGLDTTTYSAYVVVLEKPASSDVDADVVNENPTKGTFDITFNADEVGVYKLQAVLKATVDNVVRYYTGVVEIAVGAAGVEDVVVMSIGSHQMVVNDKIVEIPAPAVIVKDRTFVPFRAIGEAFGAEVTWDAATQSVTAELDGVTVVLTIGSETYTVNGVEKTADVAPYIAGDGYTMVPARFIAEAFGYTVEYTVDTETGATADVLFRG